MKLVLAIVSNDDASAVTSALTKNNFYMTRLSTTGGFLRAGNTTLIVGTEDDLVDGKMDIMAVLVKAGLCESRSDARRAVQQGGVAVDGEKVTDISTSYTISDFSGEGKVVKRGKKKFAKVVS